jgi:hypothetical protein
MINRIWCEIDRGTYDSTQFETKGDRLWHTPPGSSGHWADGLSQGSWHGTESVEALAEPWHLPSDESATK